MVVVAVVPWPIFFAMFLRFCGGIVALSQLFTRPTGFDHLLVDPTIPIRDVCSTICETDPNRSETKKPVLRRPCTGERAAIRQKLNPQIIQVGNLLYLPYRSGLLSAPEEHVDHQVRIDGLSGGVRLVHYHVPL